jgi:glycosyltransferase involved in cell wall biosynthesis
MAKKLKILEICNLDRFAASPYMLPFFKKLVERGNEVHVACRVTSFAAVLRQAGLEVHDVPISRRLTPLHDLSTYRLLKKLIAEGGYDLVHTHNPKDGIMGRVAAWKLGVPAVVHTCNGFYFSPHSPALKRRLVLAAERFAARRCHLVIFVNSEDLLLAAKKKVVGPGKAKLVYNGVDLDRFHAAEEPLLRKELSIPQEAIVLGYVGEIRREKNLDVLVKAAASLSYSHPDIFLVLVGDSSMEPGEPRRPERLAAQYNLEGRIAFTGYRSDPERFYRIFDVYVLPTSREGFGVTLIEAMATGVPVVACDVRGPREIVSDGLDGILVKDRDPGELADAIAFLLETPEAARSYAERALEKVGSEFDHKRMRSNLLSAYHSLTK